MPEEFDPISQSQKRVEMWCHWCVLFLVIIGSPDHMSCMDNTYGPHDVISTHGCDGGLTLCSAPIGPLLEFFLYVFVRCFVWLSKINPEI